jgi:NADH:ubiquinone oxidoreductase subunit E
MRKIERERMAAEITALAGRLGRERSSLIPILLEVKRKYHRIDSDAMQLIGDQLGIRFGETTRPPRPGARSSCATPMKASRGPSRTG